MTAAAAIALSVADVAATGGSAMLVGPAGVGKSYTLRGVASALRGSGRRVRDLRATSSMAAVPFGALLPLLAEPSREQDPRAPTGTALELLTLLLADRDAVLLVDDAHLLDGPSAGVVHQAVGAGVPVVLAIRDGEQVPDAIARVVTDLGAVRIAVEPLTEPGTGEMLEAVLGGPVDGRLVHVVHRRSAGLPLAVGALARLAERSSAAQRTHGAWRLVAALPMSTEVGALLAHTTAALDPDAREAAELVALADGIGGPLLRRLGLLDAAARCVPYGLLDIDARGGTSVAHPLLLDALFAAMPATRRRAHLARLLDASDAPVSLLDRVRFADWSLEVGRDVPVAELLELAAVTAPALPAQAERFARAATDAGGGPLARLRLAELLAHQHRADEARAVLDELDRSPIDADLALAAGLTRAFLLTFALADPPAALAVIDTLPDIPPAAAVRSSALLYSAEFDEALAISTRIAEDAALPADVRAHAALTRASTLVYTPDSAVFASWMSTADGLVAAAAHAIPEGREAMRLIDALGALRIDLDPLRARRLAEEGRLRALERGDDGARAQWDHHLAACSTLEGEPTRHLAELRIALTAPGLWANLNHDWLRSTLVLALALSGDLDAASAELDRIRFDLLVPILKAPVALAEAELRAAKGDLAGAGELAHRVARHGDDPDAWHAALRFGRPVAADFLRVSERLTSPGRLAQRRQAEALAARDPAALEAAAQALEDAGVGRYAVDAMAQAVMLHARLTPSDAAPAERLRVLVARFPALRSPLVASLARPTLTPRESEVARAVVAGASARAIAAELGIGVRTVETHVAHIYRKLGVAGRDELRRALRL